MRKNMSKEIAVKSDNSIDLKDKETIQILKDTVAKNTTDAEFKMFAEMVKGTGLNPFKKEIWCIVIPEDREKKRRREVQMMTGINGFYQIATSDPSYDGIEHGFIAPDGSFQPVTYPKDDYIGAWARVHVKNRRFPQEEVALRKEYEKQYGIWKTMKRHMLLKCADAISLRKALPQKLGGIYIEEEFEDYERTEVEEIKPAKERKIELKTADQLQAESAQQAFGNDNIEVEDKKNASGIYHYNLKTYLAEMPTEKANLICRKLEKMKGFEESDDLWCVPEYIENLSKYIVADESAQNSEAA